MKMYRSVIIGLMMWCVPNAMMAQTILNPSFETPDVLNGFSTGVDSPLLIGSSSATIGNWDMTASALVSVPLLVASRVEIRDPLTNPINISGSQLAILRSNLVSGVASSSSLYQDLGVSYTSNTRYTLTANLGLEDLAFVLSSFGMRLKNGTNTLAERDHSTILSLFLNSNELYSVSMSFTTGASVPSGNLGIEFFETAVVGVAGAFLVDNVTLSTVSVPEPTTIGLIALSVSGIGLGWYRYRRMQKKLLEEMVTTE